MRVSGLQQGWASRSVCVQLRGFDYGKTPRPGEKSYCYFLNLPVNCGPRGLPFGQHSLYRNNGDGTFTDVSQAAGISSARSNYGLTVVAGDFDDDGWPDIYVAAIPAQSAVHEQPRRHIQRGRRSARRCL